MPPKQRKITDVLMQCHNCGWIGTVYACECDADVEDLLGIEDEGRLRCPHCLQVVKQIGEG